MTTRTLVFDSPFLLGFEHTRSLIERAAKAAGETYPPCITSKPDPTAAYASPWRWPASRRTSSRSPSRASKLIVAGRQGDARAGEVKDGAGYLHRGIAARNFLRSFVLADGMEVEAAGVEHGLLHIDVVRPEPAERVKTIPIRSGG